MTNPPQKDYLWLHVRDLPYFRSLLRAVEARFYQDLPLPSPVLDLGCGDGHFASVTFDHPLDVGIDPWTGPVHEAARRPAVYSFVVQGYGNQLPFPSAHFASAISNSVLEHIPDLDPVLADLSRVLRPGAPFIFCVPNHQFLAQLSIAQCLDGLGLSPLATSYRSFFNRISRHYHCDSPEVWTERLQRHGFALERYWHYFSPEAFHVFEWGHYFGLPELISHVFTRRWVLIPVPRSLSLRRRIIQPYYDADPINSRGVYTFYIARKFA